MEQIEAAKPKSHDVTDTSKDTTDTQSLKEQTLGSRRSSTASEKANRGKSLTRSKSPFRSFRWKKSKTPDTRSIQSEDEGADESTFGGRTVEGADGELEGMLGRKHAWETTTKKAAHRSWDRVFTVLNGNLLNFYKDSKSYRSAPEATYRSESAVDLLGGEAEVAADYTKKKHVFRLKLANGGDYLFQCTDEEEMNMWISAVNSRAGGESGPSKSQTLPSGGQKDEPKRRSFFTLKKK